MGHHLNKDGKFKSDKYDWCPEGFFALKLSDPLAQIAAESYALITPDRELADDLMKAVANIRKETSSEPITIEHMAGKPDKEAMTQACTRCDALVVDLRGAMVQEGCEAPSGFWKEGSVYQSGNCWTTYKNPKEKSRLCAKEGHA